MCKPGFVTLVLCIIISVTGYAQVSFEKILEDNSFILKAKNLLPVDVRLIITDSLDSKTYILPTGKNPQTVLRLNDVTASDTSSLLNNYQMTIRIGTGEKLKVKKYRYQLPFPRNRRYEVIQSFNGTFSHDSDHSRYAVDFRMPVGDTICASRDGLVVWTEDQYEEGGNDRSLINQANRIMIMHDDGTIGTYVHLVKNGVFVEIGDQVNTGTPIGLSGNSGFTSTPHLHFVVLEDVHSIPIRFKRKPKILRQGQFYSN